MVQYVDAPWGVRVLIMDYDIECIKKDNLCRDKKGDKYLKSIWTIEGEEVNNIK